LKVTTLKIVKAKILFFGLLLAIAFDLCGCATAKDNQPFHNSTFAATLSDDATDAHIQLLHITANVDGSGKFVFTAHKVHYEHLNWSPPTNVTIDGEAWENLQKPFPGWNKFAKGLNLSRAWIVEREGRDVIALESTARGFNLYLDDSPNGSANYEVTIAIPRKN
jgi:hypothetical protein